MLALNNLDIDTSSWDTLLVQLILKKLDHTLTNPEEVPTIKELFPFLEVQFESTESIRNTSTSLQGSKKLCRP